MLRHIEISMLYPHPDNPRKELGDLTELAESIKARGILQNLTVVPWNFVENDESKRDEDYDRFVVVIGHRRLAAAKLAGITEVPCVISEMDHREQVATMLLENMQRNDLTVYEQAQGFQMMLDLGDTVNDIAEMTGFSKRTVKHRVKLLELDQDKFKAAAARGGTIEDYAELEKIENIELRNSVLEKIGTANFKHVLQQAVQNEKAEKNKVILLTAVEQFATRIDKANYNEMSYVTTYNPFQTSKVDVPEDADTVEYFFVVSEYGSITLSKKRVQSEAEAANAERQSKLREQKAQLDNISRLTRQLRYDFVKNFNGAKKHTQDLITFAAQTILYTGSSSINEREISDLLGIEKGDKDIPQLLVTSPERVLLVTLYCSLDSRHVSYCLWDGSHQDSKSLNMLYDLLGRLGYEMSDEERALQDGTHWLFVRQREEDGDDEEQAN